MSTRVIHRDFAMRKIVAEVHKLGLERLRVGVVGARAGEPTVDGRLTVAEAAAINHEGTDDGHIPARRFLVDPFNAARREMTKLFRATAKRVLHEKAEASLDWLGGKLADIVRNFIIADDGDWDRNAPRTIQNKGFDHPLLWGSGLAAAISHRLVRATGAVLDAGASAGEYEHFEFGGD